MEELASLSKWISQHGVVPSATDVVAAAALWSPTDGYSAPCNDAQRAHLSEYSKCGSTDTYILLGFKDADNAGYYRHKGDKYEDRDGQPLVWKVHFKPGEKLGGGQGKIKNGLKSKKQKLRPVPSTGPSVAKLPKWTPQYTGPPLRTVATVASTTISPVPSVPSSVISSTAIASVVSVSDAAVQCDILPSVTDITAAKDKVAQCAPLCTDKVCTDKTTKFNRTIRLKCFTCGGPAKTGGSTNMKNGLGSRSRRECLKPSCGDVYTHNNPKQLHENLVEWQKQNPGISFDDIPEEVKEKALEIKTSSKRRHNYMCQTPGCNLPKRECTHGKLKKLKAASLE
jgi:hypothetical protein